MTEATLAAHGLNPVSVLVHAARAATASRELLRRSERQAARRQEGRDIKLVEDEESERLIVAALSAHSPMPILTEERGWIGEAPPQGAPYWVVDPLDGSFNYHRGVPLACTAVALCVDLNPLAGVVFDFNRDELFVGAPGVGLTLNEKRLQPPPVRRDIVATGFPVRGDLSEAGIRALVERSSDFKKVRMIGSAALALAWVAAGRFDGYAEDGSMWWDVAAGLALVAGAGGRIAVEGTSPTEPVSSAAVIG